VVAGPQRRLQWKSNGDSVPKVVGTDRFSLVASCNALLDPIIVYDLGRSGGTRFDFRQLSY
jgi:hypothetical protein